MTSDSLQTALRVLKAINSRRRPDEKDVALLRLNYPNHGDLPPDELACVAVQEAVKGKTMIREQSRKLKTA